MNEGTSPPLQTADTRSEEYPKLRVVKSAAAKANDEQVKLLLAAIARQRRL
jgi:hypothetical protein